MKNIGLDRGYNFHHAPSSFLPRVETVSECHPEAIAEGSAFSLLEKTKRILRRKAPHNDTLARVRRLRHSLVLGEEESGGVLRERRVLRGGKISSLSWPRLTRIIVAAIVLAAGSVRAAEQRSATLATHAVGSLYNALGTGIATVVSRHTPITVRVQPFAGPPAWLPSMNGGDTDMGVLTSADAVTSYRGIILYKKPYKNTRILAVGGALQLSFYVPRDSAIETVADLKGKRIPADYPGTPIVRLSSTAALATAGLTYADIVKVPVSDLQSGAQAFMEGRTDAGWHSLGSPSVEEANARRGGVKFVSVIATPEGEKKMADVYPGSYPTLVKAGSATGVIKDTAVLTNDIYLVAARELSEQAAYDVVRALWEFNQELGAAHPALKAWRRERMVSKNPFIPYHPGAIKFFKEKQAWSKESEALQTKLLAQ